MEYQRVSAAHIDALWELQRLYKAEIGEDEPDEAGKARLAEALTTGAILFWGAWDGPTLAGCCSVTAGFSTFDYRPSGVFEDFYSRPAYRHSGVARALVRMARQASGVSTLTVSCADCDLSMYAALGFTLRLGNTLAYEG